jgi:hypothetical protein
LIAPRIEKMPYGIMRYDEPFLPFGKAIIDASKALVSAYVFDLAAYMALGAVGMVALERTIDYAGQDVITILHGAFGSPDFALVSDENAYGMDAVTIVQGVMPTRFMERQDRMAFILDSGTPTDSTDGVGRWWINHDLMRLNEHSLHVTTEAFLYKHRHEQFRQALREELEALRHG